MVVIDEAASPATPSGCSNPAPLVGEQEAPPRTRRTWSQLFEEPQADGTAAAAGHGGASRHASTDVATGERTAADDDSVARGGSVHGSGKSGGGRGRGGVKGKGRDGSASKASEYSAVLYASALAKRSAMSTLEVGESRHTCKSKIPRACKFMWRCRDIERCDYCHDEAAHGAHGSYGIHGTRKAASEPGLVAGTGRAASDADTGSPTGFSRCERRADAAGQSAAVAADGDGTYDDDRGGAEGVNKGDGDSGASAGAAAEQPAPKAEAPRRKRLVFADADEVIDAPAPQT